MKKFFNFNTKNTQSGFTLIETMISVTLFVVVIISGMTALLNANLVSNKSKDMRSIMDNLSFIMEDMSRNIRTGYDYRCVDNGNFSGIETPQSCVSGGGIAFEEASGDPDVAGDQWVYKIESVSGVEGPYNISKSVDGGLTWVQLNTEEIVINPASNFSVLGAEAPPGDENQPLVVITLIGEIHYKDVRTPFSLQTAVSQRLIDTEVIP